MGANAGSFFAQGLSVGGTMLSATARRNEGIAANLAAQNEALQLEQAAGQSQAYGQRAGEEQARRAQYAMSRAQAVAGASGAGATDPTVTSIIARIAAEGDYRARTAMYEGDDRARTLRYRADMSRWGGRQAQRAGNMAAIATVLKGADSFFSKYGGSGPPAMSGGSGTAGNYEAGGFNDNNPYDYFGAGP
jgi:hypothetical protein